MLAALRAVRTCSDQSLLLACEHEDRFPVLILSIDACVVEKQTLAPTTRDHRKQKWTQIETFPVRSA